MSIATPSPAVLVVDDEPGVRATAVDMLDVLGMGVFEACDGAAALVVLEQHPEIAVLFCDVRMPGISGAELATRAKELRPELRVILTSGYVGEEVGGMIPHDAFLQKPYRLDQLASAIRTALPSRAEIAAPAARVTKEE